MSRRTKYLIAALFLVLIAIPTVYVILTWSTPNPLRFRMVGYDKPSGIGSLANPGTLNMIVENTSSVPVHLFVAVLQKADDPTSTADPIGAIYPNLQRKAPDTHTLIIPPHTSLPCFCFVFADVDPASAFENIELSYNWMSDTRYKVCGIRNWLLNSTRQWLAYRVPSIVKRSIPQGWFLQGEDITPLQPALPGQTPPE